jgi:hypothetical protein
MIPGLLVAIVKRGIERDEVHQHVPKMMIKEDLAAIQLQIRVEVEAALNHQVMMKIE